MYAIIKTCGKQYKVQAGDVLELDRMALEGEGPITFDQVLAVNQDGNLQVGTPTVSGATVNAELIEHFRGPKLIIFKKKRRKGYQRRHGFRAELTKVRITTINLP